MVYIDTVYQRVLAIANKEQRGYITPQEFNLYANQAPLFWYTGIKMLVVFPRNIEEIDLNFVSENNCVNANFRHKFELK